MYNLTRYRHLKVQHVESFKKERTVKKEQYKNEIVVQHNDIIEAKYNITLQEKRLILLMSSHIKKDDKEFQIYTTTVNEICKFLQLNNKNIYKEIDDIVSKLFGRVLVVKNVAENSTTKISWLTYAKYWHGKGVVQLKFNEDLKPYMLQLKERFTERRYSTLITLFPIVSYCNKSSNILIA